MFKTTIDDIKYKFDNAKYRIQVFKAFVPILWKSWWWDYSTLLELQRAQLKLMESNWHLSNSVNSESTLKEIRISRILIDRLLEDDYTGKPWKRTTTKSMFDENETFTYYDFKETDKHTKEDMKMLTDIMNKSLLSWWD